MSALDDLNAVLGRQPDGSVAAPTPAPAPAPTGSSLDDINAALAGTLPPPAAAVPPATWDKDVTDFGQNLATGILKGTGQLGGLPHSVAQLGDAALNLFANQDRPYLPNAGIIPPQAVAAQATAPPTPPLVPPGPGWLTRHTLSPEDINQGVFGSISAINQATGGKPVVPYKPTTPAGEIVQAGAEQIIPSLIGPVATMGAREVGGFAGGAARKAYELAYPEDKTGQLVTSLLATPLTSLATTGTARGASALGRIAQGRWGSPENQALYRIGSALHSDLEGGGPTALDIASDMRVARDTPLTPLDVGGENITKLGGQAARVPGPGRQFITSTLNERDAAANQRLTTLSDTLVPGGSTYNTQKQLIDDAKMASAPAYRAFETAEPLNPDHLRPGGQLTQFLEQRPIVKEGMRKAVDIAGNEGVDPKSLGITFNEAGDPVFKTVPSWRTLSFVKTGIDSALEKYRDPITRRLNDLDPSGKAALRAQQDFVAFMDANNDLYPAARAAWSGPHQSKTAMEMGRAAFRPGGPGVDEITDDMARLSPNDQMFYKLAAKNELKNQMGDMTAGADESKAFIGNPNRQARIRTVFGPDADTFLNAGTAEKGAFRTRFDVLGGSQTGGRFAQDFMSPGSALGEKLEPFVTGSVAMGTGEPVLGLTRYASGIANLLGGGKLTPAVSDRIARALLETDPQTAHNVLTQAYSRYNPPRRPGVAGAIPAVPMFSGLLGNQ